jgi:membrane-bound ClpP family serine protease
LSSKKIQIPTAARLGLTLLVVGAILVGTGSYLHRGAFSLYGLIMVITGFLLYIITSIAVARKKKKEK